MKIAMIPARMGSQRLARKNLQELDGLPLIVHAIRKALEAGIFDQVWVNSEHPRFGEIAREAGVPFHQRPAHLANDQATSEEYVEEFLQAHPCDLLFQVHSIAPLLTAEEIREFVADMETRNLDVLLSVVNEQIECLYEEQPVNFSFDRKENSQNLRPVQRVTWSITGWRRSTYLAARAAGRCATFAGRVGVHPIRRMAGHIIKTAEDLEIARIFLESRRRSSSSNTTPLLSTPDEERREDPQTQG